MYTFHNACIVISGTNTQPTDAQTGTILRHVLYAQGTIILNNVEATLTKILNLSAEIARGPTQQSPKAVD